MACTLEPDISTLRKEVADSVKKPITLSSIAITTQPTTTNYTAGQTLNLSGLVVTATYSDESTKVVTPTSTDPANGATLAASHTQVTVSYKEGDVTETTSFSIKVSAVVLPNAVTPTITNQPVSDFYTIGDTATALTVTASVSDGGTLSYQWYRNTTNSNTNGILIDGANLALYTPPTDTLGIVYYYVAVINTLAGHNSMRATSNVAAITVTGVILTSDSAGVAGDKKITDLDPDTYYIVVEGGVTSYVTSDGTLSTDMKDINPPSEAEIIGLTNGTTYTVRAAVAFTAAHNKVDILDYDYSETDPLHVNGGDGVDKNDESIGWPVVNGKIILDANSSSLWGINLKLDVDHKYEVWKLVDPLDIASWDESRCSGVYSNALDAAGEDPPFVADIISTPSKKVVIYQYKTDGIPDWVNGMSLIYAGGASYKADLLIADITAGILYHFIMEVE